MIEEKDLSTGFAEVAAIIGIAAARQLIDAMAGKKLTLPVKPNAVLDECIGTTAATRLCAEMGGVEVCIPSVTSIARILRRKEILDLRTRGHTVGNIARLVGLSERSVWYVLRSDEASDE